MTSWRRGPPPGGQFAVVEHGVGYDLQQIRAWPASRSPRRRRACPRVEPARLSQASRLTEACAGADRDTARLWSCWPWSISPCRFAGAAASLSIETPVRAARGGRRQGAECYDQGCSAAARSRRRAGLFWARSRRRSQIHSTRFRFAVVPVRGGAVRRRDRDGLAVLGVPVHAEHRVLSSTGWRAWPAGPAAGVDPTTRSTGVLSAAPARVWQQAGTVVGDDYRGDGMSGLLRGS